MKKLLVLLLVLVPALLLVFVNAVYSAPPAEFGAPWTQPVMTVMPFPTLLADLPVDIPDPALHSALHTKTGIPLSHDIYRSDLSALTGTLDLHGLGISNAAGVQYCTNVEQLNLSDNHLTNLPDFSNMEGLLGLNLADNGFTAFPAGLFDVPHLRSLTMRDCPVSSIDAHIADITSLKSLFFSNTDLDSFPNALLSVSNLEVLYLDDTHIGAIPDNIDHLTHLKELYINNTGLESLPESLFGMTSLKYLDARSNNIESIPSSVSGLVNLQYLLLGHNKLGSLPDSVCSLPDLFSLDVSFNDFYSLPSHIGDHLDSLYVQGNRLTAVPPSVMSSPAVHNINISLNRLTSLPSGFADRFFDEFNVEFNFIDVSPGSPIREMLDAKEGDFKSYLRQLISVEDLTAAPSSDSVTLSWNPCMGGSGDGATWTVEGYVVYQYTGEMVKISDVDKSQTSFTHTGLAPETEYSYRVGVDYQVIYPGMEIDYTNRGYTAVDTTTLAGSAAETVPPASPAVSIAPEAPPTLLPAAAETDMAVPGGENALPIWAIIIAAVGALGIVGTGVAIAVILKIRKPKA